MAWTQSRKTKPGAVIKTMASLLTHLDSDHWIYMRDKVYHPRMIRSMQLGMLQGWLGRSVLRVAMATDSDRPYTSKKGEESVF